MGAANPGCCPEDEQDQRVQQHRQQYEAKQQRRVGVEARAQVV
ncbi:MAG TPA: hypothetical protein VMU96_02960 [Casimicrobiaceae bacterium]|nr:hypothetical protein [Casimicrobiaceae bacterium]